MTTHLDYQFEDGRVFETEQVAHDNFMGARIG